MIGTDNRVPDHKWWCAGNHTNVAEYRGDICYGWRDLNEPLEALMSAPIAIPTPSKADLDAAAMLLGYHPTHAKHLKEAK